MIESPLTDSKRKMFFVTGVETTSLIQAYQEVEHKREELCRTAEDVRLWKIFYDSAFMVEEKKRRKKQTAAFSFSDSFFLSGDECGDSYSGRR